MFVSRRKLKAQLYEAQCDLARERANAKVSAFIEVCALPKCKSAACASCKHIVVQKIEGVGTFVLGCGKDNPCPDFARDDIPAAHDALAKHLAEQSC